MVSHSSTVVVAITVGIDSALSLLSDTLRLVLVWKYGGYYSDLDVVVLKSLAAVNNVVGVSSPRGQPKQKVVPNSEFQFSKGHPLLWRLMQLVAERFQGGSRIEVGPLLLTQVGPSRNVQEL